MKADHTGSSLLSRDVLAKLHIAKKQLGLDDEDYRDILQRVTGHCSARDVAPDQVPALQRELRRIGWNGYLLRKDELPPLKYNDMDNRPGRPTGAQLRMLEARFKNLKGFAEINPDAAFRAFLEKRFSISDARLLDDAKFEAALSAVKRLEKQRGVKQQYRSRKTG